MNLTTLITTARDDRPDLAWRVTTSGAIRREDGACLLEAAAGTGPHTLWTKARETFHAWSDRDLELITSSADMDWWPHRMAEFGVRAQILAGLNLEDPTEWIRREEAA